MSLKYSEVELAARDDNNVVHLHISGKLTAEDYAFFGPELERLIEKHGKVRLVVELDDFHGWSTGALWEDLKFDFKHFRDLERIALVGDSSWEKGMAVFCKPFTTAKLKYFDRSELDAAMKWIAED